MNRRHSSRQLRHRPTAPTTLSATSNLYSPRRQYCAAHECRDRQRDRNILLSKRLPGGSLKVVVASASRDLRSYQLGRALSRRSSCVIIQWRLAALVGYLLADLGDLGAHLEYDRSMLRRIARSPRGAHRAGRLDKAVRVTPTMSTPPTTPATPSTETPKSGTERRQERRSRRTERRQERHTASTERREEWRTGREERRDERRDGTAEQKK
jgi:hypothetical protein